MATCAGEDITAHVAPSWNRGSSKRCQLGFAQCCARMLCQLSQKLPWARLHGLSLGPSKSLPGLHSYPQGFRPDSGSQSPSSGAGLLLACR